jgi:hypothetical protein
MDIFNFQLPNQFDKVKVMPTTKMFYGKYLCRISFTVKGAPFIRTVYFSASTSYPRQTATRLYNWAKWNYRPDWKDENEAVATLAKLQLVNQTLSAVENIKHRIERDSISIYFNSINDLEKLFVPNSGFELTDISSMQIPKNKEHVKLLSNNYTIHPTNRFHFKVWYHSPRITDSTKQQLLTFFNQQSNEEFKVNFRLTYYLKINRPYIPAGYFYARDDQYLTMINLIAPGFITKVEKIKQIDF